MPYYNLGELEYDILIDNKGEQDEKLPDRIVNAINLIKDTDTKITFPWILQILKRNEGIRAWEQAYHHWALLRKIFGKSEKDDEKNINSTDILKTFNRTNQIEKLERSQQIQEYILKTADAIEAIKITPQNLKEVLALICIIKGISLRFKNLDQGQMNGVVTNWVVYCMTQIIVSQTGKTREENFTPIVDSIEKLTNSSVLTRRIIPKTMIPKKRTKLKFVHFKQDINSYTEDKPFNLENAIIQSTNIELEIKNAKDDFIEKLIQYEAARKKMTELKKVEDDIYYALDNNRVIPYESRYIEVFPLRQTERLSWESYASEQNYYYFYFISLIKRLIGYYESPHEVMNPLLQYIQREEKQLLNDYTIVQTANSEYQRLKKIKTQLNLDIQSTKIAMKLQNRSTSSKNFDEVKSPFYVDLEKKNKQNINPDNKTKKWKRYIAAFFKILCWTGIGIGVGFGVGTLIGTFIGGGIANIISIPLCMLMGGVAGFIASSVYVCWRFNNPPSPPPSVCVDVCQANPVTQNIYKKLKVQPKIQHDPSPTPLNVPSESDHLDHKHSTPFSETSYTIAPRP